MIPPGWCRWRCVQNWRWMMLISVKTTLSSSSLAHSALAIYSFILLTPTSCSASLQFTSAHLDLSACLLHKQYYTLCEYITKGKLKNASDCLVNISVCVCLATQGSKSLHIHLLFLSIHSMLLHLIPSSIPPIFPIKKPPQLPPAEEAQQQLGSPAR